MKRLQSEIDYIVEALECEIYHARGSALDELGIRMRCRKRIDGESDAVYRCDVLMRKVMYTDPEILARYAP